MNDLSIKTVTDLINKFLIIHFQQYGKFFSYFIKYRQFNIMDINIPGETSEIENKIPTCNINLL